MKTNSMRAALDTILAESGDPSEFVVLPSYTSDDGAMESLCNDPDYREAYDSVSPFSVVNGRVNIGTIYLVRRNNEVRCAHFVTHHYALEDDIVIAQFNG